MGSYAYTAVLADNSYVKGQVKAGSQKRAILKLEKDGLLIINIKKERKNKWLDWVVFSTVSRQEKIHLTRHLHAFLEAGISLDQSLSIAAEQMSNKKFKDILNDMHAKIVKGQALHMALGAHKKYFTNYFINMIKVGEQSGNLDNILKHLLDQQEKEYELLSKIRGALVYPALIILVALVILIFMLTFVIPTVAAVLLEYGGELPLPTKIIIAVSNFLIAWGWLFFPAAVLFAIFLQQVATKTYTGKRLFEKFLFTTPGIKRITLNYNLARFTRSMSAPLLSGLAIDKSLELAEKTLSNSHYHGAIKHSVLVIHKGIPLSEVLLGYPNLFPPNVTRMVEVGEKTGRVDQMFSRLADFHEKSLFNIFNNMSSIIEPFLLVTIGLVVGFIAVSVLTPIWRFAETV